MTQPPFQRKDLNAESSEEEIFTRLEQEWRKETGAMSLVQHKVSHLTYLRIIGRGKAVLPFIFQQLKNRRKYWFIALEAITLENPVPSGCSFEEATEAWLAWGKEHHYA